MDSTTPPENNVTVELGQLVVVVVYFFTNITSNYRDTDN